MLQDVPPIKVKEETSSVEELEDSQASGGREAKRKEAGVTKLDVKKLDVKKLDVKKLDVKNISNKKVDVKNVSAKNVGVKNVGVKNVGVKKASVGRAVKALQAKPAPVASSCKEESRKALKKPGQNPSSEVKRQDEKTSEQEDKLRWEALKSIQSRGRIRSSHLPEEETSGGGEDGWKKDVPCKFYNQGYCSRHEGCPYGHFTRTEKQFGQGEKETLFIIDESVTLKTIDVEKHMAMFGELGGVKLVNLARRGSEFEVKIALNSGQWKLADMTKLTLWIGGVRVLVEDPSIFRQMSRARRTRSESCSSQDKLKEKAWPVHWKNQWSRRKEEEEMYRHSFGESSAKRIRRDSSGSSSGKLVACWTLDSSFGIRPFLMHFHHNVERTCYGSTNWR